MMEFLQSKIVGLGKLRLITFIGLNKFNIFLAVAFNKFNTTTQKWRVT